MMSKKTEKLVEHSAALKRLGGDEQLFSEFITIFMEDSPALLEQIRGGLDSKDESTVERNAHALKGLVSNFGAKECVEVALKLELAGRAGSVDNCDEDFQKLESLHGQLTEELKTLQ